MISVIGESLVDLVITIDGAVDAALGGAPFNTARACGRLGVDVRYVGAVSTDRFGTMIAARLAADGVDVASVTPVDVPTTIAAAEVDGDGSATYRFYLDGTSAPALESIPLAALAGRIVFTGGLALVLEPMATAVEAALGARTAEQLVMVDVNCRPTIVTDRSIYVDRVGRVLRAADVVKVSDEDLAYLAPGVDPVAAATDLLASGPSTVLLTRGGDGVVVITASGSTTVEVARVNVVDTIGAGDAFGAGFLAWWSISGLGRREAGDIDLLIAAVRAASDVAAIVVTRRGADPPWRNELAADWAG
jgi:fructokinase